MKVFIVEDDRDLSAALAEYLLLQGVDCDFAYSGPQGLTIARANNFDILILDLMLPRLNGIEVCQQLCDQGCATPVLSSMIAWFC